MMVPFGVVGTAIVSGCSFCLYCPVALKVKQCSHDTELWAKQVVKQLGIVLAHVRNLAHRTYRYDSVMTTVTEEQRVKMNAWLDEIAPRGTAPWLDRNSVLAMS